MFAAIKSFWNRHKHRYQVAVSRYGWPVVATAILLNVVWIATLVVAVKLGLEVEGVGGAAGLLAGLGCLGAGRWSRRQRPLAAG